MYVHVHELNPEFHLPLPFSYDAVIGNPYIVTSLRQVSLVERAVEVLSGP